MNKVCFISKNGGRPLIEFKYDYHKDSLLNPVVTLENGMEFHIEEHEVFNYNSLSILPNLELLNKLCYSIKDRRNWKNNSKIDVYYKDNMQSVRIRFRINAPNENN